MSRPVRTPGPPPGEDDDRPAPSVPLIPVGPEHRTDRFEAGSVFHPRRTPGPPVAARRAVARRALVPEFLVDHMRTGEAGACLVLLSVLDLFMTYILLRHGVGAYEANPIARWWFVRWNIAGMTAFKFGVIGLVIGVCEFVERHRPGRGKAVLWLGCVGAAAVVVHGARLFYEHILNN